VALGEGRWRRVQWLRYRMLAFCANRIAQWPGDCASLILATAFSGTVRDNILFSSPYDEARYNEAIKCCCLEKVRCPLPLILTLFHFRIAL
jgi:hypothetical protein